MSRSYKKVAGHKDHYSCKFGKRCANHRVRQTKEISSGGFYKKLYDSWDISDYNFRYWSYQEVVRSVDRQNSFIDGTAPDHEIGSNYGNFWSKHIKNPERYYDHCYRYYIK